MIFYTNLFITNYTKYIIHNILIFDKMIAINKEVELYEKILVIVSIFSVLLVACSSSPTKKAEGKWQNENGDIITIKVNLSKSQLKVKLQKDQ